VNLVNERGFPVDEDCSVDKENAEWKLEGSFDEGAERVGLEGPGIIWQRGTFTIS
jgi:hypothetical protein